MKNLQQNKPSNIRNKNSTCKGYIVIPFAKGVSENVQRKCSKYGINTYFRGNRTIDNILVSPVQHKSGTIYCYRCNWFDCDEEYIGESARTFLERCKEHHKAPFPIQNHQNTTGHQTTMGNFGIVGREGLASPGQSKNPYTWGLTISPKIETLVSVDFLYMGWGSSQHPRTPNQAPVRIPPQKSTSTQNITSTS